MKRRVGSALLCTLALALPMGAAASASAPSVKRGDPKAVARLRRSIAKTRDEKTARVEGSIRIQTDSGDASLHMTGVTDLDSHGDARITMTAGPELFGTSMVIETRQIDGVLYANYSDILAGLQDQLPKSLRGRDWVRTDASELTTSPTDTSSNPSSQLDVIRGLAKGSVETRGTETVNGAETTRYHAVVDFQRALERVPKKFRETFSRTFEKLAGVHGDMPVDIWLDAEGRVRRQRLTIDLTVQDQTVHEAIRFDYVDFGVPVVVSPPPSYDVMDLQDFLDAAKSKGATAG